MTEPIKMYWDSCAWLALINAENNRFADLNELYESAKKGKFQIWTSTFTYAEVYRKQCGRPGTQSVGTYNSDSIQKDWLDEMLSQDFIKLIQLDKIIALKAKKLLEGNGVISKPPDGIHLASALHYNIDIFVTYDEANLLGLDNLLARRDGKKMQIRLPDKIGQGQLFEEPQAGI